MGFLRKSIVIHWIDIKLRQQIEKSSLTEDISIFVVVAIDSECIVENTLGTFVNQRLQEEMVGPH